MKKKFLLALIFFLLLMDYSCYMKDNYSAVQSSNADQSVIVNHTCVQLNQIPLVWAKKAKTELHIAYGHTSHGSQITYGMMGLTYFRKEPFIYEKGAPKGSIDLRDNPFGGEKDLGNPDNKTWANETKKYLENNKDINVVMWSWCGQLSSANGDFVKNYLDLMQGLENQFPDVTFVYMTGHLDGTGLEGILAQCNRQIREFCISNKKTLFDFADIESYDPDGQYFGGKYANDACWYDSNGDKKQDKNWAQEWQNSHKKGEDWYDCYAAHTEPVNANMKAYAAWWLLARVAGWNGKAEEASENDKSYDFYAEKLQSINLFKGTDQGYDLERVPTRLEGAAMLTRLLGGEQEAQDKVYTHPFIDAKKSWGNHYVGYLHQYQLTKGISSSKFGCDMKLEPTTYVTFLLRVLGYSDNSINGDFQWNNSLEKVRDLGMIHEDYYTVLKKDSFDRGHMAKLTYLSLTQKLKGGTLTLLEKLINDKVVDRKAAEQL